MQLLLVWFSTCFGRLKLRTILLGITLLNLAAGVVMLVDGITFFMPSLTIGDLYEELVFTEDTPKIFGALPPAIFILFSLTKLYGVIKSKPKWLYAYALYSVARIGTWLHTLFMIVAHSYDNVDYVVALSSSYVLTFLAALAYQCYLLILVRAFIIEIALNNQNSRTKIISVNAKNDLRSVQSRPIAPPAYEATHGSVAKKTALS